MEGDQKSNDSYIPIYKSVVSNPVHLKKKVTLSGKLANISDPLTTLARLDTGLDMDSLNFKGYLSFEYFVFPYEYVDASLLNTYDVYC